MCIDSISGWSLCQPPSGELCLFLPLTLLFSFFHGHLFYGTYCMELPTNEAHLQGLNWSKVSHFQPPPPCNNALALIVAEAHKHSEALWGCLSRAALEPWKPSKTKLNSHFFFCMMPPWSHHSKEPIIVRSSDIPWAYICESEGGTAV